MRLHGQVCLAERLVCIDVLHCRASAGRDDGDVTGQSCTCSSVPISLAAAMQ